MNFFKQWALALSIAIVAPGVGLTQTANPDHSPKPLDKYSRDELLREAKNLRQKADNSDTGSASEVLEKYPGHFTMLGVRERSGKAELHRDYAYMDVILDGSATLITGGAIADPTASANGEVLGTSIVGGKSTVIHKGDILHIPANTAHQMMIPPGGSLTYFVIKALQPSDRR
jgi:hypothetical protein